MGSPFLKGHFDNNLLSVMVEEEEACECGNKEGHQESAITSHDEAYSPAYLGAWNNISEANCGKRDYSHPH